MSSFGSFLSIWLQYLHDHVFSSSSCFIINGQPRQFNVGNGNNFGVPCNATYDYVIIGGGTAGNAIASRLAGDPNSRVTVIEAGGFYEIEDGNRSVVPGYAFQRQAPGTHPSSLIYWGFKAIPQQGLWVKSSLMQMRRRLEDVHHSTMKHITGMLSIFFT